MKTFLYILLSLLLIYIYLWALFAFYDILKERKRTGLMKNECFFLYVICTLSLNSLRKREYLITLFAFKRCWLVCMLLIRQLDPRNVPAGLAVPGIGGVIKARSPASDPKYWLDDNAVSQQGFQPAQAQNNQQTATQWSVGWISGF